MRENWSAVVRVLGRGGRGLVAVHRRGDDEVGHPDGQRPERDAHQQPGYAERSHMIGQIERHLHNKTQQEQADPQTGDDHVGALQSLVIHPIAEPRFEMLSGQTADE